eukprot:1136823-Pelagomonas_calceolata.AAC.10
MMHGEAHPKILCIPLMDPISAQKSSRSGTQFKSYLLIKKCTSLGNLSLMALPTFPFPLAHCDQLQTNHTTHCVEEIKGETTMVAHDANKETSVRKKVDPVLHIFAGAPSILQRCCTQERGTTVHACINWTLTPCLGTFLAPDMLLLGQKFKVLVREEKDAQKAQK